VVQKQDAAVPVEKLEKRADDVMVVRFKTSAPTTPAIFWPGNSVDFQLNRQGAAQVPRPPSSESDAAC